MTTTSDLTDGNDYGGGVLPTSYPGGQGSISINSEE